MAGDLAIVLDAVSGYDPKDVDTAFMEGRAALNFSRNLDSVSLDGLRIGKLTSYLERANGTVSSVIEDRLDELEAAGVEIIEIEIEDLDSLISESSMTGLEFRADLNQYFAEFGSSEISNLADVVDQGLFHAAIDDAFRRESNNERDEAAYQRAYANRAVLREVVEALIADQNLDAIVYPPIGELPVFTGESQLGNNCSISANSGLPAISLPAGFSADGLPVGMELLGGFLDDARLVSIAHQIELLTNPRRMPPTTPPLVNGRAPEPMQTNISIIEDGIRIGGQLTFDLVTGFLSYDMRQRGSDHERLQALTLQINEVPLDEYNDPVVANLLPPQVDAAQGELYARPDLRNAIYENRLYMRIFADGLDPAGAIHRIDFE